MKLIPVLAVICATLFGTVVGPGVQDVQAQAITYVHFRIVDKVGDPIVGAPVTINGSSGYVTDIMGNATTIAWGCNGCSWIATSYVKVYNKTYEVDTSSVEIYNGIHADRHYTFTITHIPDGKGCRGCPDIDNPFAPASGEDADGAGSAESENWSALKSRY